ncbi:hypothetical protein [Paenibacillus protaetiae]|uniref:Endolytic transglycosylase MltG n=1 Tax=Paenibacillus protaetiae TaxID=2509456 RepID=A0A4P6EU57_9BACL|nr:hypothetical protein [Paenibacillus protaetiae]QAY65623.1 hypothetical protein ET464_03730 [Paenibacillus protaetiae]
MLRNRSFVLGAGIGIICGALLLQLMLVGQDRIKTDADADTSGTGEAMYSQSEVDAMIAAEKDSWALNHAEGNTPAASSSPAQQQGTAAPSSGEPEKPAEQQQAPAQPKPEDNGSQQEVAADGSKQAGLRIIRIENGMGLEQAGSLLQKEGLVAQPDDFVRQMKKSGKKARAGYFLIAGQPTLEEIADIVSSAPLSSAQKNLLDKQLARQAE